MGIVRIFQVARSLKVSHTDILSFLKEEGFDVKSHMSIVDEEIHNLILHKFSKNKISANKIRKEQARKEIHDNSLKEKEVQKKIKLLRQKEKIEEESSSIPIEFKYIFFDLDNTLVDTSKIEILRDQGKWNEVYQNFNKTVLFPGVSDLICKLKSNYEVGVITSSPRKYAKKLIDYHNLNIPIYASYDDTKKHKPNPDPFLYAID